MNSIEVHYSPKQVSCPESDSITPRKPAWVVEDWLSQNLPVTVVEPLPVTREQLLLAHTPDYVDGVLNCTLANGFGSYEKEVADSLPWTCGSLLSAARAALNNRQVACSPSSGFSHAGPDYSHRGCTLNGLMVAAMALKAEGKAQRVGILNCDYHYGGGTADIMHLRGTQWIRVFSQTSWKSDDAKPYLARLVNLVGQFEDCDLLIYQAGANQHIDDDCGGFLTTAELALRDKIVFTVAKTMGLPVVWNLAGGNPKEVWNLAGGYQSGVPHLLELHRNTMAACIAAYL